MVWRCKVTLAKAITPGDWETLLYDLTHHECAFWFERHTLGEAVSVGAGSEASCLSYAFEFELSNLFSTVAEERVAALVCYFLTRKPNVQSCCATAGEVSVDGNYEFPRHVVVGATPVLNTSQYRDLGPLSCEGNEIELNSMGPYSA